MLNSLLRNVASGLRDHGVQQGFELCEGSLGMCSRCSSEWNRKRCPLDDNAYLEKWSRWQLGQLIADPRSWASKAREQIEEWTNPAMLMLFEASYDLALEGETLAYWHSKLRATLRAWTDDGWLAWYAVEARERVERHPGDLDYHDIAETLEAVLALAAGIGEEPGEPYEPVMVDGVNTNPRCGRPTSEWGPR